MMCLSGQTRISGLMCPGFMLLDMTDVTAGALCSSLFSSLTYWVCMSVCYFLSRPEKKREGIKSLLQHPVNVVAFAVCR